MTRLIDRIFSAYDNGELDVIDQINNDYDSALKDGINDTVQLKYVKLPDQTVEITDKDNGEHTIVKKSGSCMMMRSGNSHMFSSRFSLDLSKYYSSLTNSIPTLDDIKDKQSSDEARNEIKDIEEKDAKLNEDLDKKRMKMLDDKTDDVEAERLKADIDKMKVKSDLNKVDINIRKSQLNKNQSLLNESLAKAADKRSELDRATKVAEQKKIDSEQEKLENEMANRNNLGGEDKMKKNLNDKFVKKDKISRFSRAGYSDERERVISLLLDLREAKNNSDKEKCLSGLESVSKGITDNKVKNIILSLINELKKIKVSDSQFDQIISDTIDNMKNEGIVKLFSDQSIKAITKFYNNPNNGNYGIGQGFRQIGNGLGQMASDLGTGVSNAAQGFWGGIKNAAGNMWNSAKGTYYRMTNPELYQQVAAQHANPTAYMEQALNEQRTQQLANANDDVIKAKIQSGELNGRDYYMGADGHMHHNSEEIPSPSPMPSSNGNVITSEDQLEAILNAQFKKAGLGKSYTDPQTGIVFDSPEALKSFQQSVHLPEITVNPNGGSSSTGPDFTEFAKNQAVQDSLNQRAFQLQHAANNAISKGLQNGSLNESDFTRDSHGNFVRISGELTPEESQFNHFTQIEYPGIKDNMEAYYKGAEGRYLENNPYQISKEINLGIGNSNNATRPEDLKTFNPYIKLENVNVPQVTQQPEPAVVEDQPTEYVPGRMAQDQQSNIDEMIRRQQNDDILNRMQYGGNESESEPQLVPVDDSDFNYEDFEEGVGS